MANEYNVLWHIILCYIMRCMKYFISYLDLVLKILLVEELLRDVTERYAGRSAVSALKRESTFTQLLHQCSTLIQVQYITKLDSAQSTHTCTISITQQDLVTQNILSKKYNAALESKKHNFMKCIHYTVCTTCITQHAKAMYSTTRASTETQMYL